MGNISYFLGCSSPEGFHSFFDELCPTHSGGYTYIIKGGPGTGKSSLMKRINSALTDAADILLIRPSFARRRICARAQLLDSGRHFPAHARAEISGRRAGDS